MLFHDRTKTTYLVFLLPRVPLLLRAMDLAFKVLRLDVYLPELLHRFLDILLSPVQFVFQEFNLPLSIRCVGGAGLAMFMRDLCICYFSLCLFEFSLENTEFMLQRRDLLVLLKDLELVCLVLRLG